MSPAPLACRPRLPDQPRGDPDPTLRAPTAPERRPPISRSDLTNSSFDAGPEESPYEGGKFYVSPPLPQIAPHQPARNESPPRAPFSPVILPLRAPPRPSDSRAADRTRRIAAPHHAGGHPAHQLLPVRGSQDALHHQGVASTSAAQTAPSASTSSKIQWSPALSIKTAMLSLQALLSTPEPNDPQDAVVAKQYLDSYEEFVKHEGVDG